MANINDVFAIAIQLCGIRSQVLDNGDRVSIRLTRSEIILEYWHPKSGTIVKASNELEFWQGVAAQMPELIPCMARAPHLYHRGLARRAELMLAMSPQEYQRHVAAFTATGRLMFDTVMTHLNLSPKAKKLNSRPMATKRGISSWYYRSKATRPQWNDPELVTVSYFPSPVEPGTYFMHVSMPSVSNDDLLELQAGLKSAIAALASQGIIIDNVSQCTYMEL